MCEICQNWARPVVRLGYLTNHHPNCPHYNDSLMTVWKVSVGGIHAYVDNLADAIETKGSEDISGDATITEEQMHREVFENLPEFEGY